MNKNEKDLFNQRIKKLQESRIIYDENRNKTICSYIEEFEIIATMKGKPK